MQVFDAGFQAALGDARDGGVAPVWFVWFRARDLVSGDPVTRGFWSGDETTSQAVVAPGTDIASVREYIGGCNLAVGGITYVSDLTDTPVSVEMSQIAPAAQEAVRGLNLRLAQVEIHVTSMHGGQFLSAPQLQFVGIVDEVPVSTPAAGGQGGVSLTVRSEIMHQLTAVNPAKSSDAHQKRRLSRDRFCEYSSTVAGWKEQWYKS
nr:hypothetical protein [uncultured Celeribacter sp.]